MSEPESLSSDEDLDVHIRRHHYDRLIMLSDGIFAIATTLAALEIRLPEHAGSLAEMISATGRTIAAYGLSFLVIAIFWISNRDLFARLKRVDSGVTGLTLAMLCLVAVIPASAHVVYIKGSADASFRFYALTMMACGILNTAMWVYAVFRPGLMRPEVPARYRWMRIGLAATLPLIFGAMLVAPIDQIPTYVFPVVVLLLVVRRFLAPWWFRRIDAARALAPH